LSNTTRRAPLHACGSTREECGSNRQWLTNLREERAGLSIAYKRLVDRIYEEQRAGGNEQARERVVRKLEADLSEVGSAMAAIDDEVVNVLAEGVPEPRGMSLAQPATRIGQERSYSRSTGDGRAGVLSPEMRVADWAAKRSIGGGEFNVADADEFSIGNIMLAQVRQITGDPNFRDHLSDVEARALSEGTDSAGGYLTPEILSVNLIDKVRNAARVVAAGATTVPLDSDKHSIPRLTGDPSGAWRSENGAFGTSNATFDRVTFTPQSYGFIVQASEELAQDMVPGAGRTIENALVQTAALELDRVALRGTGTAPEPRGVLNQSGVTKALVTGANGGTPTRYTEVMTGITVLQTANREPTGWMMSPRSSQFFAGLADTTNQPLNPPQPVADLARFVTAQIPNNITKGTSSDCSEVYIADWRDLLLGIRLGIQLRLLTERYADNGQIAWRVHMRADVQLAHPESFYVLEGVRP
jgi:HK97 family phage major capsid protein